MHISLTTERLIIQPHTKANLVWLNTLFNSTEEQYCNGDEPPKLVPESINETEKLMERILNRPEDAGHIDYAIHRRTDEMIIGCGMIAHIDLYNHRCDLGISMGYDKGNWGKGYGREALQAIISYCFIELNVNRIGVEIYEFNTRSINLFQRLGFHREGMKKQFIFKDGMFKDELLFSLLKENWKGIA
jgi:RimJ/RimL family protein N-acetyltransferase